MKTNKFQRGLSGRIKSVDDVEAQKTGFTLIELLVVIASLAILAVTLLPAFAGTRQNSQVIECLANQRQLAAGWIMYAGDNNDRTPGLLDNGGSPGTIIQWSTNWCGGNMSMPQSCTNTQPLMVGQLFPYIKNVNVYHCAADDSVQGFPGTIISSALRVRSYSMSETFGKGEWLPYPRYKIYNKYGSILKSSDTWVFIDENERSINDCAFGLVMTAQTGIKIRQVSIVDYPSGRHAGSTGMSFADGHSIIHKWQSSVTYTPPNPIATTSSSDPGCINDMVWLSSVTSVMN